ncbi:TPR-repeat-containing chaperone protein DNAJ [Novymonas esmeraldas]|uniref:TPR-repeat-containing chaperone protein DNAJ n=1 Tax=Novymonas esmeraldas TaxID=1808958 RepID=A0AAW0FAP2_9TRYP
MFEGTHTRDVRHPYVTLPPGGSSAIAGTLPRGFYGSAPSTPGAAGSSGMSPPLFTLDGGAVFARTYSAQPRHGGVGSAAGSGLSARAVRPPHNSTSPRPATEAASTAGVPPASALASRTFAVTGVGCTPRLTGATPSRRTPPPRVSSAPAQPHTVAMAARPHLNNYLAGHAAHALSSVGTRVRMAHPSRSSSAPHTTPAAATAPHETAPAANTRYHQTATAVAGSSAADVLEEGTPKRARSLSPTPPSTASSSATHAAATAAAAAAPVRPFLRPHLPSHRGEGAPAGTPAPATVDTDPSASAHHQHHHHPAIFARSTATAAHRVGRQRPSVARMTRSSTLSRPVLLTKGASRTHQSTGAAATAATAGSSAAAAAGVARATPAAAPAADAATASGTRAIRSPSPSLSPEDLRHRSSVGSSSGGVAGVAAAYSPYLARPSPPPPPPRPQAGHHRRSRRASLVSLASNSSASFLLHERHVSPDDEAAATLHFFRGMPDLSSGVREAADGRTCSSPEEELTMGATASALEVPSPDPLRDGGGRSEGHRSGPATATTSSGSSSNSSSRGSGGGDGDGVACTPAAAQRRGAPLGSSAYARLADCVAHVSGPAGVVERLKERGNVFLLREEFSHAIATYTEAIRLAPGYEALWGNRASAFLLTFRYLPAVADCLYVLHLHPGHVQACWRVAKAYAAAYRLLEAKKYYQLAQRACEKDEMAPQSSTAGDDTPDMYRSRGSGEGATAFTRHDSRSLKSQRDARAMAAEEATLELVEGYWQHLRHERWADALEAMDRALTCISYTGPTAVSWQALRLEALLHLQPKKALAEAEALHRRYPDSLELYPVLTKAIFYSMHDAAATKRCLGLLDEAAEKRHAQNRLLKVHTRYCATQLRERLPADSGNAAALHMEAWGRQHFLKEDSRAAELRHTIEKFARHRDAGNAAYEAGDWDAAALAYTRCLETDRRNHALLAAVYCNRTAVYMQAGRWRDALGDADAAVSLSPQHATAYGRRGRVQLYLLAQEYEGQRAVLASRYTAQWTSAVKERLQRYADAAVVDLTRAVELAPTLEHKTQLQQALVQRQAIQAALRATAETPKATTPPSGTHRAEEGRRPQSASSAPPPVDPQRVASAAARELTEQLKLLGLSIVAPSAPGEFGRLPAPKVIAKAYREAALRWHPDKWVTASSQEQQQAEQQFKSICVAYQALRERSGAIF